MLKCRDAEMRSAPERNSRNKGFVMGENLEGLPVSKGRGMYEEKRYGTWETLVVPDRKGEYPFSWVNER